jgi:helix-turn-helix protein
MHADGGVLLTACRSDALAPGMDSPSVQRRLWSLFEPVHAVTYFTPRAGAAFEAAGLRGFWRRYFAGRTAPLGEVGPGPVTAAFFGFAPRMVARALPDIWTRISPPAALAARAAGARDGLAELLADPDEPAVVEAAGLLSAAAQAVDLPGRVLAAANADLPWPDGTLDRLWHAATILREHRGDGHVAALLTAGVDGCESVAWRAALDGGGLRDSMQPARGWTDAEWEAATERLRDRGWLTPDGSATAAGRTAYAQVEALTDRLAAGPWQRLGTEATDRCARLLEPLVARIWRVLPETNPIPLRRPATPAPGAVG